MINNKNKIDSDFNVSMEDLRAASLRLDKEGPKTIIGKRKTGSMMFFKKVNIIE